jgi:5-methylcytosine-specific restriction endonuclease McrA
MDGQGTVERTSRHEDVGPMRWTLELESHRGRWRAAWTTDVKPDLPCGCEPWRAPWHVHHCHSVKRSGGRWGWHRSEQSAIACAEKVLRYWRHWFEMNRWWNEVERPRRAQERQAARSLRRQVLDEEPACRLCGKPSEEVDHIQPIVLGGSSARANLQALCSACHAKKTAAFNRGMQWR